MPTIKPYFCLAFADPERDLDHIASEYSELDLIFTNADPNNSIIDRRFLPYLDSTRLANIYFDLEKRPLTFFHFSGHANHHSFLTHDGSKMVNQLCKFFQINTVKIAFLNACNTAGLVKDILNTTSVRAVIATNRKVNDELAKEIAIAFYKAFIGNKSTLREAFNYIDGLHGEYALNHNAIPVNRETGFDDDVNTIDSAKWAWELYYTEESVLDMTIDLLTSDIESDCDKLEGEVEIIDQKIDNLKMEKAELEKQLTVDYPEAVKSSIQKNYKNVQDELDILDTSKRKKEANIKWLIASQISEKIKKQTEQKESTLAYAIKLLNYSAQRKLFKPPPAQPFCSFIVLGDENSVSQLLLTRFYEDNTFDSDTKYFPISSSSRVAGNLWEDFSRFLFVNETKTPREIIEKLIVGYYFGKMRNMGKTHQHLLVQYKSNNLDEETILTILSSFWKEVTDFCNEKNIALTELAHKLIFIIIDETASPEKESLLKEKFQQTGGIHNIPLIILPFIKPLNKEELCGWTEAQQLQKWGIDEAYTETLYGKTNGQIRKVLREIKTKLDLDIQLLENI